MAAMKEHKVGDRIVLKKKCRVLKVKEDFYDTACNVCYYNHRKKCGTLICFDRVFIDITNTLSENDKLLLERGLLKL